MSTANIKMTENTLKSSQIQLRLDTAATDAEIITFINAAKAVTLGTVTGASKSLDVALFTPDTGAPPKTAQRGQKWLVRGTGADGDTYVFTIPTADPSLVALQGSDAMDITAGAGLTLKNAIEALWGDEAGGAMTVNSITYRNYTIQ